MRIAMYGLRVIGQGSGGVERAVEELSTRLAARGHDVTVFCRTRYNVGKACEYKSVRLVNLPCIYTKHFEAITHSLCAALATTRGYDVVHVHAVGPALTSFIPRWAGRRVVATVHAMDWRREKWGPVAKKVLRIGARAAIRFPHKTIVVSRLLQDFFRSEFGCETVYIPNGVTPGTPRSLNRLRRFGVTSQDYLLYLGRLVPEKGAHLLIEAFRQTDLDCRLLIAGDATHTSDYLRRLQALANGDPRIVFTGPLFGEDKDEAFTNAMALVFPSLLEGMPLVLLEALTYGCPVLCSNIPENLEIVQGDQGLLPSVRIYEATSTAQLREELEYMTEQSARLRKAGQELIPRISAQYDWEKITDAVENLYEELWHETK